MTKKKQIEKGKEENCIIKNGILWCTNGAGRELLIVQSAAKLFER